MFGQEKNQFMLQLADKRFINIGTFKIMARKKKSLHALPVTQLDDPIFEQEGVIWCPDGTLKEVFWFYQEEEEVGRYYYEILEHSLLPHLMKIVRLHPDCTLASILHTVRTFQHELEPIVGNWMNQFLIEAFEPVPSEHIPSSTERLDQLELYYAASATNDTYHGLTYPSLHALGESFVDYDGTPLDPNTSRPEQFSISFTPINQLIHLPIHFRPTMYFEISHPMALSNQIALPSPATTILQVVYGIFWELSFYGPPEKRDQIGAQLLQENPAES